MKTKILLLAAAALLCASCVGPITPGSPNPLDTPGGPETAAKIRERHMKDITSNPAWRE